MPHDYLGCGDWHSYLTCRGGGDLVELPYHSLSASRRLDDMSSGSVTIGFPSMETSAFPDLSPECCGLLAEIEPWAFELALWRDGDDSDPDNPTWCGPIIDPAWSTSSVELGARDLFQWFERRILDRERSFVGVDLATIFRQYVSDGLHHDPLPNIDFSGITATGILGDRTIDPNANVRAADALRELARSGLDFTMLGRKMKAGGTEIPTADLGVLTTSDVDGIKLRVSGLDTETESIVVGARSNNTSGPVVATSGGVDAQRGLLQSVTSESVIEDAESCQAAADSRHELLSKSLTLVSCRLLPTAPVAFEQLIPGAVVDLRLEFMCKALEGVHRLSSVNVSVGQDNVESVTVEFSSIGTAEEVL